MLAIFGILYLIIVLIYILAALFIIYHIVKFSLHKSTAVLTLAIFLPVFGVLLFTNLMLFLAIDWNGIFSFIVS